MATASRSTSTRTGVDVSVVALEEFAMTSIDETHDATRQSFVRSANGHPDFPIQNLPLGVFSRGADEARGGVAIGDHILDLGAAVDSGSIAGEAARAAQAASQSSLNAFFALDADARRALRRRLERSAAGKPGSTGRPVLP
jgi:fumarylacetoacetase